MKRELMRYTLQLEMLEPHHVSSDRRAIELLHSEFTLAQNAARFDALSHGDIVLEIVDRSVPQEGVARYIVELHVEERSSDWSDDHALALVRQAFANAFNASFFSRVSQDEMAIELLSRAPFAEAVERRAA
jgi:hypothetical protein